MKQVPVIILYKQLQIVSFYSTNSFSFQIITSYFYLTPQQQIKYIISKEQVIKKLTLKMIILTSLTIIILQLIQKMPVFNQKQSPKQNQEIKFPPNINHHHFLDDEDQFHREVSNQIAQPSFSTFQHSSQASQRLFPQAQLQSQFKIQQPVQSSESDSQQEDYGQYNITNYINKLSEIKKERLKTEHPTASPVHFMNRKQKKKFFRDINNKFINSIQKLPQKMNKSKKILKFNNKLEILSYSSEQSIRQLDSSQTIRGNIYTTIDQN